MSLGSDPRCKYIDNGVCKCPHIKKETKKQDAYLPICYITPKGEKK